MKRLFTILFSIALILPLYSQEEAGKKELNFTRHSFEIGFDMGVWLDNGLAPFSDIFRKKIEIDLPKLAQNITEDGAGVNFGLSSHFFINIKDITLAAGLWDFGFTVGIDGGVGMNIPKSLFTLIAKGNNEQRDSSGKIGASGGIFTEYGLKGSAKYQVQGRTLYVGIKPAIFIPAAYIPSNTGISYHLYTERPKVDGANNIIIDSTGKPVKEEGLFLDTSGGINVYTPTSLEKADASRFLFGPGGFDLSLEGEYALFPFLDIGGNVTHIPFAAAALTNLMKLKLLDEYEDDFTFELSGTTLTTPELNFTPVYSKAKKPVHRPLQFDLYARYKPLKSELLVIRPNIGFTVNINKGDEKGYFNAGLEALLNLKNIFTFYIGSGYKEEVWRQKAGLGINLRAFELDIEAALRDPTFDGCFKGRCLDFNIGLTFGW